MESRCSDEIDESGSSKRPRVDNGPSSASDKEERAINKDDVPLFVEYLKSIDLNDAAADIEDWMKREGRGEDKDEVTNAAACTESTEKSGASLPSRASRGGKSRHMKPSAFQDQMLNKIMARLGTRNKTLRKTMLSKLKSQELKIEQELFGYGYQEGCEVDNICCQPPTDDDKLRQAEERMFALIQKLGGCSFEVIDADSYKPYNPRDHKVFPHAKNDNCVATAFAAVLMAFANEPPTDISELILAGWVLRFATRDFVNMKWGEKCPFGSRGDPESWGRKAVLDRFEMVVKDKEPLEELRADWVDRMSDSSIHFGQFEMMALIAMISDMSGGNCNMLIRAWRRKTATELEPHFTLFPPNAADKYVVIDLDFTGKLDDRKTSHYKVFADTGSLHPKQNKVK